MLKNYFTFCLALFGFSTAFSQNIATPNPGFENWNQVANYFNPVGWNNLNSNTAIVGVFTCIRASAPADVHSGTYAIKLTTKSVFGITANGIASTATLITSPPYGVTGGIPYTERPDSIVGWYKYTPASAADSGFVQFVLLGAANDTIGFVRFSTPNTTVSTYTRFSAPVTYFSSATPALSYWILSASGPANPVVNSSIIVDDIDLVFNPSGIDDPNAGSAFEVVSNMVDDFISVKNNSNEVLQLNVYDSSGRIVKKLQIGTGMQQVDLQSLKSGIYFYRASNSGVTFSSQGKIFVL